MMILSFASRMGVEGGETPSPAPAGDRAQAWPQRVGLLLWIRLSYVASIAQCYYCHVMKCNEVLQIRIDPRLHDRIARLRQERDINVSAWLRRLIEDALDREFPSSPEADAPLTGWRPHRLDNGDWGSIYLGDTSILPPELVGARITVQSKAGQSWTTTATAVLERSSEQVIVTNSGRPSQQGRTHE